jgi:4-hydroxybenzoyl-CoA thioesterase
MAVFTINERVTFKHCDPAGLVYHPHFVEMVCDTVEAFFADVVGWPYKQMHGSDNYAVPTININMDMKSPAYHQDELILSLTIVHLGNSSVKFNVICTAESDEAEKFNAVATLVLIKRTEDGNGGNNGMTPVPWPDHIRAKMQEYVV